MKNPSPTAGKNMEQYLNKIICGDCLEVMKKMPDKSVDLVLTSPPFNLGNNHHTGSKKHKAYNDDLPENEYQKLQITILNELHRIVAVNGSVLYQHKNRIKEGVQISPYQWLLESKWKIKQEIVWFNGSQNFDKIRFYPMTERVYWLAKTPDTIFHNVINHHDLFHWKATGTNNEHTRAFPLEMATDLIQCFPLAKNVMDIFSGSGTTAVAAKQLGRNFIGIEISPEYCKIAQDRLGNMTGQLL